MALSAREGQLAFFIHPNQFLVFFRDPENTFTPKRIEQILIDNGVSVKGEGERLALNWGKGPTLYASIVRGEVASVLAGRLMGRGRKHREFAASCDAYVEVVFESLDEVLDEINTLIVTQSALQEVTGGLLYLSWNQSFHAPGE